MPPGWRDAQGEPIGHYGLCVMNTYAEIMHAMEEDDEVGYPGTMPADQLASRHFS